MKKMILALTILSTLGCKAPTTPEATTQPTTEPMLKTSGCNVGKAKGVMRVECADGSFAEAGVPTYHIKSSDGTDLDNLMFLQNWSQVGVLAINKSSGNILSYDATGNITKINRTLYTSADCSGQAHAFFSDFIVKNKVMANNGAMDASVEAIRVVGYESATVNFQSKFEGGVCSSHVGSAGGASLVEATQFDDTDPVAIGLPIEIVFEQ